MGDLPDRFADDSAEDPGLANPQDVPADGAPPFPDVEADAPAEALVYGWEHWDRVPGMSNPAGARRLNSTAFEEFGVVPVLLDHAGLGCFELVVGDEGLEEEAMEENRQGVIGEAYDVFGPEAILQSIEPVDAETYLIRAQVLVGRILDPESGCDAVVRAMSVGLIPDSYVPVDWPLP